MKPRLVELLACPSCGGRLELVSGVPDPDRPAEIATGELACDSCARRYPVRGGVPRLLPQDQPDVVRRTAAAFGWQWREFAELHDEYEAQFLDWIDPLQPDFFRDKVVLDAGCGNGRHAFHAARYGAREVVAMDLSDAVEAAYANVGRLDNAHVVQGNLHDPPFRSAAGGGPFDFVYSIGVLHHLPDPEAGFRSLGRFVRPGGGIFSRGYGRGENPVVPPLLQPPAPDRAPPHPPPAPAALAVPIA